MSEQNLAPESRIVMAKDLATRWLQARTRPEYRMQVYYGAREVKGIPNLLKSFRDGKIRMGSVEPLGDLGIDEHFDSITVWSSNRVALMGLKDWFETRGFETTGVW